MEAWNGQSGYEEWCEDLEYHIMGLGLNETNNSARMLGLFISHGGRKVKEVYNLMKGTERETVGDPPTPVNDYRHARNVVDDKLKRAVNQTFETFTFRGLRQREGEDFQGFTHRCEVAVDRCGFSAVDRDRHIRDQLVLGTNSTATREKALSENLQLKDLVEKGRGIEASKSYSSTIKIKQEPVFQVDSVVNAVSRQSRSGGERPNRKCYNCGEDWPHRRECPAKEFECTRCGRIGHFVEFCNRPVRQSRGQYRGPRRSQYRGQRGSRQHANMVDTEEYESDQGQVLSLHAEVQSDLYAFSMRRGPSDGDKVQVMVDNVPLQMLPDTGASVSIIDRSSYDQLCQAGAYPLFETDARIFAYGSDDPLKLKGYFNAKVSVKGKRVILTMFVLCARSCGNLLSKKACQQLGLIEICGMGEGSPANISGDRDSYNPTANISGESDNSNPTANQVYTGNQVSETSRPGKEINGIPGDAVNPTEINLSETAKAVLETFPVGIGRMKDVELRLDIDKSVTPVIQSTRRIPFSQRKAVETKIGELVEEGIIEKVEGHTPWLSPIHVVRQADKVRMVVDMTVANKAIRRSRRTLPTPEEMHCEISGSQYFTKLDMNSAYHQITLAPESRDITAFTTHCGTYRYKTLFFGCSSASEDFDSELGKKLAGLKGVIAIADDMLIHAKTKEEHEERLLAVLVRLLESGITLSRGKCVFGVKEVSFFGQYISGEGTRPMINDNLKEIQRPQTKSEVRSYIGLVNFIGKFIPNFSTIIAPISSMLSKTAVFVWGEEQEEAYLSVLEEIRNPITLRHFDPSKETSVIVDASPVGLCAILVQEERPVLCTSRKLTQVETRYSQTEREALSVVWACERLHFYVYGIDFTVVTDHKALEILYSPKGKPAARILRWYVRLLAYSFVVKYSPGRDNPADYFSRKPVSGSSGGETLTTETEEYVNNILLDAIPNSISLQEVTIESLRDPILLKLVECIKHDRWTGVEGISRYGKVRSELTYKNGIVLRGQRIVLPQTLRSRAIMLAHASHMGMTRTKQYIRSKLWWPGLDDDIEGVVKTCGICQAVSPDGAERLEPLRLTPCPAKPFSTVNIDLFGPLASGETILGIVDDYSKWPELYVLKGEVSTEDVIRALDELFARFGNAGMIKSDNGPQFRSWKFSNFMEKRGIKHHLVTPYYPQANSTVERFFRTLKKFVKTCSFGRTQLKSELNKFLRLHRNTPSRATGRTPASLILSYNPKMDFPSLDEPLSTESQKVKEHNLEYKLKAKAYTDITNHRRVSDAKAGDKVLLKNLKPRKHEPVFSTETYTITHRSGNQVKVQRDSDLKEYIRPLSMLKILQSVESSPAVTPLPVPLGQNKPVCVPVCEPECETECDPIPESNPSPKSDPIPLRRGGRERKAREVWQHPG